MHKFLMLIELFTYALHVSGFPSAHLQRQVSEDGLKKSPKHVRHK
jgi:hypothetical protein